MRSNLTITIGRRTGNIKASPLQSFVVDRKTITIPPKDLYMGSCAVEEHKDIAADRVCLKMITHQPAQTIKSFAHISRTAEYEIALVSRQTDHRRTTASTSFNCLTGNTRYPP